MDSLISAVSTQILNPLIMLLFGIALIVFIYGLVRFIANGGDEETHTTARRHIVYGLIGMAIMFSAFAITKLIAGVFDIDTSETLDTLER